MITDQQVVKPYLKWAGNKSGLAHRIASLLSKHTTLVEPFMGAGSIFLNTDFQRYLLSDANEHLVGAHKDLICNPGAFIARVGQMFAGANNRQAYESVRMMFNAISPSAGAGQAHNIDKSAMFVYLNRHCYNGLCRYNRQGGFNAPFGRYAKPYFPKAEMEYFAAKAQWSDVTIKAANYLDVLIECPENAAVYLDPPYVPANPSNLQSWVTPFTMDDQVNLVLLAQHCVKRGCTVVISNHDLPKTRALYAAANEIIPLNVRRSISCKGDQRRRVGELLAVYHG